MYEYFLHSIEVRVMNDFVALNLVGLREVKEAVGFEKKASLALGLLAELPV